MFFKYTFLKYKSSLAIFRRHKYKITKTIKNTKVAIREKLKMLPTMVINTSNMHSSLSQPKKLCLRNTDW